jgi:L-histidine N-alpha-methyltransferase
MDVCAGVLEDVAASLECEYPWLTVHPLAGDYHGGLAHLPLPDPGPRLFVFLGGTIGNFTAGEADDFIQEISVLLRPGDALLLGADRIKSHERLHAAYNDAAGLTAEFNRNVLHVLNRELQANFRTDRFRHDAIYNADETQIEMYLVAEGRQTVSVEALKLELDFEDGERMLTEISRKFTDESLRSLLQGAGLHVWRHYETHDGGYSLVLAGKRMSRAS